MTPFEYNIAVLGLGSWGITLSNLLVENGYKVSIWENDKARAEKLMQTKKFDLLDWINISDKIKISNDMLEILHNAKIIIFAVPSNVIRKVAEKLYDTYIKNNLSFSDKIFINVAKGIEENTFYTMSEIISKVLKLNDNQVFTLSGPTHAEELSKKIITTCSIAGKNIETLKMLQNIFSNNYFRVYTTFDLIGVELGGAAKNIIAIAAGIIDGLSLGDNTKAALITRGLVEISRLGTFLGAKKETFYGLSGLGDLIVTCSSKHSRNRYFGERLGEGEKTDTILKSMNMVAEGVLNAKSIYNMSKINKIDMPIINEVYCIIYENKSPEKSIQDLMNRTLKEEMLD